MPGKRENHRPNPRPAPTFAIFKVTTLFNKMLEKLDFVRL